MQRPDTRPIDRPGAPGERGHEGRDGPRPGSVVRLQASLPYDDSLYLEGTLLDGTVGSVSETAILIVSNGDPGRSVLLEGTGLAVDGETGAISGTVTGLTAFEGPAGDDGRPTVEVARYEGLEIDGAALTAAMETGDLAPLGEGLNLVARGSSGDDAIRGTARGDRMALGEGDDRAEGGAGRDVIFGGEGDDTLLGGEGNDILGGGAGDDSLEGGAHADVLRGGDGDDLLSGGDGRDILIGGEGDDTLDGGAEADILVGGPGADTFLFAAGDGRDSLRNFRLDEDRLVLDLAGSGLELEDLTLTEPGDRRTVLEVGEDAIVFVGGDASGLTLEDFDILLG